MSVLYEYLRILLVPYLLQNVGYPLCETFECPMSEGLADYCPQALAPRTPRRDLLSRVLIPFLLQNVGNFLCEYYGPL